MLKTVLEDLNLGVVACGGKGRRSRETPKEILDKGVRLGLSSSRLEELREVSRLVAKADNVATQSGHQLYHHVMFISEDGDYCVVQQGMNTLNRSARRFHWFNQEADQVFNDPGRHVVADRRLNLVLNTPSRESRECRKAVVDIAKMNPGKVKNLYGECVDRYVKRGYHLRLPAYLKMPKRLNWDALLASYELQPSNFKGLLSIEGMGPATVRGLCLISELIYGSKPSWKDPAKFSFAFGGKDGVPYPVNRRSMDEAISFMGEVAEGLEGEAKREVLKGLSKFMVDSG